MPVKLGKDDKGCYAKWGDQGAHYYYECGDEDARNKAKEKAYKQGYAIGDFHRTNIKKMLEYFKWIALGSSNLDEVKYIDKQQILQVRFLSGSVYQYSQVPKEVYQELLAATSHGSYFYWNIRDNYRYKKISD